MARVDNTTPTTAIAAAATLDGLAGQNSQHPTDGDLVVLGSGAMVRGLAEHDLVDEYRQLLFLVILGVDKCMFDERGHFARFELSDSVVAPSGVVILTYTRNPSD